MGHFGAKYYVEGLRLPPSSIHHQIGKWFYYKFAAGICYTRKSCSRPYSIELKFYSQNRHVRFLSHSLGVVRGNVRTSSIARWKKRVNFLFAIIERFSLALTVETL